MLTPEPTNTLLRASRENYLKRKKEDSHKVPSYLPIILILLLIGQFALVYFINDILPTYLTLEDEEHNREAFIGQRARETLKGFMEYGPRVQGSRENEEFAVNYLLDKIYDIKKIANTMKIFEVDLQVTSGAYALESFQWTNAYSNIQNVVVKLHDQAYSGSSILINCHFDTVPTSPGGGDDGVNCAVAIEVLRKLATTRDTFQHGFIFLFNGAEETPLQASHGFIVNHKWAKEARVLINLEGAGAYGKSLLFQAGPRKPWLLEYYRDAAHIHASVMAEEVFLTGVIPSDTDFRIFNTFGNVTGFDFALFGDAYRYHTQYDGFDNIPKGTYQFIGDVCLSVARSLANAPELSNVREQESGDIVYYEYLGWFLISYTQTVAIVLHSIVAVLVIVIFAKYIYDFKLGCNKGVIFYLIMTFVTLILGIILSVAIALLIALILDETNSTMSWYANQWLVGGLYAAPTLLSMIGIIVLFNHLKLTKVHHLTPSMQAQIQALCMISLWTIILMVLTILGIRSAYIFFIPILFQLVAVAIINVFKLYKYVSVWSLIYIAATILPNMCVMQIIIIMLSFMLPVSGRNGSADNPEILVGLLTVFGTVLTTSLLIPLVTIVRKPFLTMLSLAGVFVLFLIFVYSSVGFPYSGNPDSPKPQRYWVYHSTRTFRNDNNLVYKSDSGFFIRNMDYNSPRSVEDRVDRFEEAVDIRGDCENHLYCGLPIGRDTVDKPSESTWIPAGSPSFPDSVGLVLNSKIQINETRYRYKFTATGPDHMEIYLSPRSGFEVVAIDLVPGKPISRDWDNRLLYVILHGWGKKKASLSFAVDVDVCGPSMPPVLDIAVVGRYMHDHIIVPEYQHFLDEFPTWTALMPMLSQYESWVY